MNLEAFKTNVLPVKNKLYRFAHRLLGDATEAQDVVQEVLIKVWRREDDLDKVENMEAWCMRITRNLAYDKLKSKHIRQTEAMPEGMETRIATEEDPYSSTETNDMIARIRQMMKTLPDKQRQVMQLRDIEGYSYKEIGEIMDLDMNQVKVNLFRARKQVRTHLSKLTAYGLQ